MHRSYEIGQHPGLEWPVGSCMCLQWLLWNSQMAPAACCGFGLGFWLVNPKRPLNPKWPKPYRP